MVRTTQECQNKTPLRKGSWSPDEDRKLIAYIQRYGIWNWSQMPKPAGLARSGKSCRLRWMNYLRPDIKRGNFSKEEEETILKLQQTLGNRWSAIAAKLPGRTDNEIKNYWHTHLKKCFKADRANSSEKTSKLETSKALELEKAEISGDSGETKEPSPRLSRENFSSSCGNGDENDHKPQIAEEPSICETFGKLQTPVVEEFEAVFSDSAGFTLSSAGVDQMWLQQEPILLCESYSDASISEYWASS